MLKKIEDAILNQFAATSSRVGHCIDERWIVHNLARTLNPKEQDELDSTIGHMVDAGLIEASKKSGMLVLALTQKGFDFIYPDDPVAAREKIRQAILSRFASTSARVGHFLDERWIVQQLVPQLTPKEQLELDASVKSLIDDGLVTAQPGIIGTAIVLTQLGFDAIY